MSKFLGKKLIVALFATAAMSYGYGSVSNFSISADNNLNRVTDVEKLGKEITNSKGSEQDFSKLDFYKADNNLNDVAEAVASGKESGNVIFEAYRIIFDNMRVATKKGLFTKEDGFVMTDMNLKNMMSTLFNKFGSLNDNGNGTISADVEGLKSLGINIPEGSDPQKVISLLNHVLNFAYLLNNDEVSALNLGSDRKLRLEFVDAQSGEIIFSRPIYTLDEYVQVFAKVGGITPEQAMKELGFSDALSNLEKINSTMYVSLGSCDVDLENGKSYTIKVVDSVDDRTVASSTIDLNLQSFSQMFADGFPAGGMMPVAGGASSLSAGTALDGAILDSDGNYTSDLACLKVNDSKSNNFSGALVSKAADAIQKFGVDKSVLENENEIVLEFVDSDGKVVLHKNLTAELNEKNQKQFNVDVNVDEINSDKPYTVRILNKKGEVLGSLKKKLLFNKKKNDSKHEEKVSPKVADDAKISVEKNLNSHSILNNKGEFTNDLVDSASISNDSGVYGFSLHIIPNDVKDVAEIIGEAESKKRVSVLQNEKAVKAVFYSKDDKKVVLEKELKQEDSLNLLIDKNELEFGKTYYVEFKNEKDSVIGHIDLDIPSDELTDSSSVVLSGISILNNKGEYSSDVIEFTGADSDGNLEFVVWVDDKKIVADAVGQEKANNLNSCLKGLKKVTVVCLNDKHEEILNKEVPVDTMVYVEDGKSEDMSNTFKFAVDLNKVKNAGKIEFLFKNEQGEVVGHIARKLSKKDVDALDKIYSSRKKELDNVESKAKHNAKQNQV